MQHTLLVILSVFIFSSCNKSDISVKIKPPVNIGANIRMVVGSKIFNVLLYDNSTAEAILAMLPITMDMREMNGHEKYYDLPNSLPSAEVRPETIQNGDIMLYGSRTFVLFYETFSTAYSYTKIGRLENPSGLKAALRESNVTVRFEQISESIKYTLNYNTNGATSGVAPSAITADEGTNILLNSGVDLNRSGYTFVGWNTNSSGTGVDYTSESNYTLNNNVTLYAKWSVTTNSNSMKVSIGNSTFTATFSNSATAKAFKAMLPLTLKMSDFNNNEKVCSLPSSLTIAASSPGTIHTGDIMLYGSSSLVLFYETFSTPYSYTRIGQIDNVAGLKAALGSASITIKFE